MVDLILGLMLLFQLITPVAHDASGKPEVWLLRDGGLLSLPSVTAAGGKTKGLDNYIYTGGDTNLGMDLSFASQKAVLRITDNMPVFTVHSDGDVSEPVLVRLKKKKDRRILRMQPSSATIDNKYGFRKQDIMRLVLTVNPDKSFTMQPERSLKPGEYIIVTGSPNSGCDFGVDK